MSVCKLKVSLFYSKLKCLHSDYLNVAQLSFTISVEFLIMDNIILIDVQNCCFTFLALNNYIRLTHN